MREFTHTVRLKVLGIICEMLHMIYYILERFNLVCEFLMMAKLYAETCSSNESFNVMYIISACSWVYK